MKARRTATAVADAIPNLAGQRVAYLEAQLKALKDGSRKNPIMNAMAAQLGNEDIANVAAFFGSLPAGSGKSDFLAAVNKTRMVFPDGYRRSYTMASSCPISCCSTPAWHATPAGERTSPTCCATKSGTTRPSPLDKTSHMFTVDRLTAVAKAR